MTRFLILFACAVLVAAEQVLGTGTAAQTASLGLLSLAPILRSPDSGDPSGGGRGTIGEKLAAAQAEVGTLNAKITSLEDQLKAVTEPGNPTALEISRLNAALTEKETALATAQADLTAANTAKTTAEAEVAKLTAEKKTVEEQAQEMVAALGFPANKLPGADDKGDSNDLPSSNAELEAELAKLPTHKEKSALIKRYEAARAGADQ